MKAPPFPEMHVSRSQGIEVGPDASPDMKRHAKECVGFRGVSEVGGKKIAAVISETKIAVDEGTFEATREQTLRSMIRGKAEEAGLLRT